MVDWPQVSCAPGLSLTFLEGEALEEFCGRVLQAVFREQGRSLRLSLRFCGDEEMSELHERFFQDPTTTDVISFSLLEETAPDIPHQDGSELAEGELIVCLPFAERKAKDCGNDLKDEVALYLIHGCLHLLGFDDQDEEALEEMVHEEKKCLERLGFSVRKR